MKKPTHEEAKVLANLFPSSANPRKRQNFDPHNECVAGPSHAKKKKFTKSAPKPASIEVIALKSFQRRIPRGAEIQTCERIKKIKLNRAMTPQQVKEKIIEKFSPKIDNFTYLECVEGCLAPVNEDYNGIKAITRRGALYICQCAKVSLCSRPCMLCYLVYMHS